MIKLYVKHHQSTTINFRLGTRLRGCWITKQESGLPSEFLTIMVMKNAFMLTFVRIVKSITNLRCFKAFKTILGRISHSLFFFISYPPSSDWFHKGNLTQFPSSPGSSTLEPTEEQSSCLSLPWPPKTGKLVWISQPERCFVVFSDLCVDSSFCQCKILNRNFFVCFMF